MVQYLAKFMPNFANDLEPIRALTDNDSVCNWSRECDEALNAVKRKVTNTPVLVYFDPEKELVLQVDSSKEGLGAAILQGGRPTEFALRTLTQAEQKWAQTEKETLSLERFDQYTYGRKVHIQNDHKPLATILKKPLSQASRRIHAGTDDEIAQIRRDLLVCTGQPSLHCRHPDPGVDIRLMAMNSLLDVPDKTTQEVLEATQEDPVLQTLFQVIDEGWPARKSGVPESIRLYFDIPDTLSRQDGIILKGERILIPFTLRSEMKKRLHSAHLGYDSMFRRARELLYWPGMAQDIKQTAEHYEACQRMKPQNQKETPRQHSNGQSLWVKVGINRFELDGRQYLVTVDYFSSFIEVDYLTSTTAGDVIIKLKIHFA